MKIIMESWRQFVEETNSEEKILEEGWKKWLLPVIMATNLSVGSMNTVQAAPKKADVQRMIIRGGMTQTQKNKLLKMPRQLNMLLGDLNEPLRNGYKDLSVSVRNMNMRIIGMKQKDFPLNREISMQELKDFLAKGKIPVIKIAKKKNKKKEKGGFLSKVKGAFRYLDRESPIGLDTGLFDDD